MPGSVHHTHTILIVEDNPDDEMLTMRGLAGSDLRLVLATARDGATAIEFIEEASRPWSLILCDLKLPRQNGDAVIEALRSNPRNDGSVAVIFTSSDLASDIERCRRAGADSFVKKPMAFDEYIDVIHRILHYWLVGDRKGPAPACEFATRSAPLPEQPTH